MKREMNQGHGAFKDALRTMWQLAVHPRTLFFAIPVLVTAAAGCAGEAKKPALSNASQDSAVIALPFAKVGGDTMFAVPAQDSSLEFAQKLDGFISRYAGRVDKGEILASLVVLDSLSRFVKQQKDAGRHWGIDPNTMQRFSAANDAFRSKLLAFAEYYYKHPESQRDDARPFEMLHMYLWNYLNFMDNLAVIIGANSAKADEFMIGTVLDMAAGLNRAYGTGKAKNQGNDWQDRERLKAALAHENGKRGLGLNVDSFEIK